MHSTPEHVAAGACASVGALLAQHRPRPHLARQPVVHNLAGQELQRGHAPALDERTVQETEVVAKEWVHSVVVHKTAWRQGGIGNRPLDCRPLMGAARTQLTCTIDNWPPPVNLDALHMVGGVAKHQVCSSIDKGATQAADGAARGGRGDGVARAKLGGAECSAGPTPTARCECSPLHLEGCHRQFGPQWMKQHTVSAPAARAAATSRATRPGSNASGSMKLMPSLSCPAAHSG